MTYTWLHIAGKPRGRVIPRVAAYLGRLTGQFSLAGTGFSLRDDGLTPAARSELLQQAALQLRSEGLVPGWRGELCALLDENGSELARFERGAFRTLGLRNQAVHVNGFRRDGKLWIARRSPHKASSPNKLDNMAAGAISAGETPMNCAVRELWEEAGVPADLAAGVRFSGNSLVSLRPLLHGIHEETIFCADLALPEDFTPCCQDGEVSGFILMDPASLRDALQAGEFSVEAALVVSDWLARTGRRKD